ncbi:RDD family protein [Psychrobacter sp. FDAARGOS_221]|uniref:RDD family protein n=1 Tax=Psychrobacter sp. FDAARGOS_221 TaxID=1975705 RepID=UPI000BB557E1|nr:RDD family protein [Psychrobacter sp. FDAARGOS_221]PNK61703.1 RDD family protein [Psychrobacter sp. FDAARGOS_221]
MQIFLARNGVQAGPYTLTELNNMLATQQVALTDLMWHEGMEQWVPVGEMTHGQYNYNPNAKTDPDRKRTTVAELYGQQPSSSSPSSSTSPFSTATPSTQQRQNVLSKATATYPLASIASRVLAGLIDALLFIACYIPFLSGINYDFAKITATNGDMEKMTQLALSVPEHLSSITSIMFLALFTIQLLLLLRRGQTLGKLLNGIRIVDEQSKKLASATNVILLRSVVTSALYLIPMIGTMIMLADFVVMTLNKQRRSIHDKIAKTIVVKADSKQLEK